MLRLGASGTYTLRAWGPGGDAYDFSFTLDGSAPPSALPGAQDDAGLGGDAPGEPAVAPRVPTGVALRGFLDGDLNDVADAYSVALAARQCSLADGLATIRQVGVAAGAWAIRVDLQRPDPTDSSNAAVPLAQSYGFAVGIDGEAPNPGVA